MDSSNNWKFNIEVSGAQGCGDFGGRGTHIYGEFTLTGGTVLKIMVGQEAPPYLNLKAAIYKNQFGGGSYITDSANNRFLIAGVAIPSTEKLTQLTWLVFS